MPSSLFRTAHAIVFGAGSIREIGDHAKRLGGTRVLVVTDKGVAKAGVAESVLNDLVASGLKADVWDSVMPEPPVSNAEACGRYARTGGFDLIVGLGGGSSMDVAKLAAVLVTNDVRLVDIVGTELVETRGVPTILVPTTAGTGSEVTPNAVVTVTEEQLKKGAVSSYFLTNLAVLDPLVTVSLPPAVTAATGMDAYIHAIESYTSPKATVHTEMYSLEAVRLISANLRTAVADGGNVPAREGMLLASMFAGVSIANAGTGAVHAMAYPLGGQFGVSHGVSNAVLLAAVMEYNLEGNLGKFAKLGVAMGAAGAGASPWEAAAAGLESVRSLLSDVGIPGGLHELRIPREALPGMAAAAFQTKRLIDNNPRAVTEANILSIYERAY